MSAASKACQQQAKHVSSKQSMSAASNACQQQATYASSKQSISADSTVVKGISALY
jgi:hypothetical protein